MKQLRGKRLERYWDIYHSISTRVVIIRPEILRVLAVGQLFSNVKCPLCSTVIHDLIIKNVTSSILIGTIRDKYSVQSSI